MGIEADPGNIHEQSTAELAEIDRPWRGGERVRNRALRIAVDAELQSEAIS